MKTIVVKWIKEKIYNLDDPIYLYDGNRLIVTESTHKKFIKNRPFRFEFFKTVANEGYTVIILPMDN